MMMRLLGAALVAAGAAWLGFRAAAALSLRARALEEMAQGLALLEQELELDGPPLPQLMERLGEETRGPAKALFRDCRQALDRLEREPFSQAWERLVRAREELGREGRAALLPLGEPLGRCGCEEQQRAVNRVRQRLTELARRTEEERRRQGKVYQVLGLSGGAFLIILLL